MAQRRMFNLKIVDSDAFLDMPSSSQLLYFHLGMHADDDGFVSPKKVMRVIGSTSDDLQVLAAKRFVLPFENGVVVIKHWWIHNTIFKDRYHKTTYIKELNNLKIKENGAYTEKKEISYQNDNKMLTQPKLNEPKLNKTNKMGSSLPRTSFPKENYIKITEAYKSIKGVEPQGNEWLPIQQEIRIMFENGRTVEQIIQAMHTCQELYEDWTMNTVRMKIADIVANRIGGKPGEIIIKSTQEI